MRKKDTWNDQGINFRSFVPINGKRILIRSLASRVWEICAVDALYDLDSLQSVSIASDEERTRKMGVQKKYIFTSPMFKGDIVSDIIHNRLPDITDKNSYNAKLQIRSTWKPILFTTKR